MSKIQMRLLGWFSNTVHVHLQFTLTYTQQIVIMLILMPPFLRALKSSFWMTLNIFGQVHPTFDKWPFTSNYLSHFWPPWVKCRAFTKTHWGKISISGQKLNFDKNLRNAQVELLRLTYSKDQFDLNSIDGQNVGFCPSV